MIAIDLSKQKSLDVDSKIGQSGRFIGLNYLTAPIKGLLLYPNLSIINLKNVLKNKDKVSDTIKTVDSSIKGIKKIFGAKKNKNKYISECY